MDCLVTKLKGSVNDDSLLKVGEFRMKFDMTSDVNPKDSETHGHIYVDLIPNSGGFTVSVIGDGYIGTSDSNVTSESINVTSPTNIYVTDDVKELSFSNKYNIMSINCRYCRDTIFNIADLDYSSLIILELYSSGVYGDVSNLFKNSDMSSAVSSSMLVLFSKIGGESNKGLYGDITEVVNRLAKNPNGLRYLNLDMPNVHGTIKGIVSSNYAFGSSCGDITLDLSGLNLSGKTVKITSYTAGNNKAKLTGDVSSLKSATLINLIQFEAEGKSEISGDIIDAITGKYQGDILKFTNTKSTTTQDFSKLTSADNLLIISNQFSTEDWHIPFTWTKDGYQGQYIIALETVYMQSHTEDMLVDMASKNLNPNAVKTYHKSMSIMALDLAGATESITSAINTLSGKGVTVSITYLGGAKGASLMSEETGNKFAIVYKGKDLIIEPTDLNKATVSAAYDCTYKEFDSYEEAQAYVDANGLEYRKSE